jgi:hypothetical protein
LAVGGDQAVRQRHGAERRGVVARAHRELRPEMRVGQDLVHRGCEGADVLIMAAAVADYEPASAAKHKIKRKGQGLVLELRETPDILASAKGDFVRVGFAAESRDLEENARDKLQRKGLHLIVANDITAAGSGFGTDTNQVVILDASGGAERLPLSTRWRTACWTVLVPLTAATGSWTVLNAVGRSMLRPSTPGEPCLPGHGSLHRGRRQAQEGRDHEGQPVASGMSASCRRRPAPRRCPGW